jgi:hypothetical protein
LPKQCDFDFAQATGEIGSVSLVWIRVNSFENLAKFAFFSVIKQRLY